MSRPRTNIEAVVYRWDQAPARYKNLPILHRVGSYCARNMTTSMPKLGNRTIQALWDLEQVLAAEGLTEVRFCDAGDGCMFPPKIRTARRSESLRFDPNTLVMTTSEGLAAGAMNEEGEAAFTDQAD